MMIYSHDLLRYVHVLAFAYWIGGEWGVYNAALKVVDASLPIDERLRHMDTAYRIDIVHRFAVVLLLPLGLHMGYDLGVQPLGGWWLNGMWALTALWLLLTWMTFAKRGTDLGLTLTKMDDGIRYILMPVLIIVGVTSLMKGAPLGAYWYAAKVTLFGGLFIIGLFMRRVMRRWIVLFRDMKRSGSTPAIEAVLSRDMRIAIPLAYLYWLLIAGVAFLGVTKPF